MSDLTPAGLARRLKNDEQADDLLNQIVRNDDNGVILSHLVTNPDTSGKVVTFLKSNLNVVFPEILAHSDPSLTAMGLLAQRNAEMRPALVEKAAETLPTSAAGLNILLRVGLTEELGPRFVPLVARYTDRRESFETFSLAAVVLSRLLPTCEEELTEFVIQSLAKDTVDSVVIAFSALAITFNVNPVVGANIFNKEAVLSPRISSQLYADENVVLSRLEFLSNACVVKEIRPLIHQNFEQFISTSLTSHQTSIKLLAGSVRTKLIAGNVSGLDAKAAASELDDLSIRFENYVEARKQADSKILGYAIESLATTATLPSVRKRATLALIKSLAKIIQTDEASWVFGSLSVLVALTDFPFKETAEQQRMKELRSRAGQSPFDVQEPLTADEVAQIVDKVLESKVVQWLGQGSSRFTIRSREQTVLMLRNMASQQQKMRRVELASQGGVIVPLYLWITDKENQKLDDKHKSYAAASISKILATIPPEVAFNDRFKPHVAIVPLASQIYNPASDRKNLDTFEALLALTNLASLEDDSLRREIVFKAWGKIESTLETEFQLIQRASIELICNLTTCEEAAGKFINGGTHGSFLMSVLGKCLDMDDKDGRLAAAGAIAMLVQWDGAPEALGHNDDVVQGLINALDNFEDSEFLLRVLTALHSLVKDLLQRDDDEVAEALVYHGGISRLEVLVEKIDPTRRDCTSILTRILRMLAKYKLRENVYVRTTNYKPPPRTSLME